MALAVEEILNNQKLKNELVENAFQMVQQFSTERMASEILKIYHEILAG